VSLKVKASVMRRGEIGIFALKGQNTRGIEYDWKVVNVKIGPEPWDRQNKSVKSLGREDAYAGS
jgi:hypothetical protein